MKPVFGWKEEVSVQLYRKNGVSLNVCSDTAGDVFIS